MECLCIFWGCQSFNSVEEICAWCRAHRGPRPFTDLRPNGPWKTTSNLSNAEFVARVRANKGHPLSYARFFTTYFFRLDRMHVWDLKGVTAIWIGSVLRLLVIHEGRLGGTMQERLDRLNDRLDDFHRLNQSSAQLKDLRLDNLINDGWSTLSGKLVKAANTRHLSPWVLQLSNEFFQGPAVWHGSLRKVSAAIDGSYRLMERSEFFMPAADEVEFQRLVQQLGKHWQCLRHHFQQEGEMHFQVTPKVHYGMHLPEQNALLNPRLVCCYAEESLMGVLSQMWEGSNAGPNEHTVQMHVMLRYCVILAIELKF